VTRFEAPRGTHDILPSEQPLWQLATSTLASVAETYGYRRIQTPAFEDAELFLRTAGAGSDVVAKEMYAFEDRGGRPLALRPEGTAPICRAYIEHGMHREPQPLKLYTQATMYRYAAPQKGRYREHWQQSIEAIGSDDPAVDAEIIQLYTEVLRRLGVARWELELNSIGDAECRPAYVAKLEEWLDAHPDALDDDARQKRATTPLRVFDVKSERVRAALEDAPKIGDSLCAACSEHFAEVRRYLDAFGVAYTLVPTLVRGLDYYTRTTFEFVGPDAGSQSTICAGGRYDGLIEQLGGPPTPGIGFGAGVERLVSALEDEGIRASPPTVDLFFLVEPDADRAAALTEMAKLRAAGVSCDADFAGRSMKGQRTQLGRSGARGWVHVRADGATIKRAPDAEDEQVDPNTVAATVLG
jgi:histidyl-tRNA synthetase